MKKLLIKTLACFALFGAYNAHAQFTFTVNPGFNYNGANFGYKTGIFLPYGGVTYFGGTSKYTNTYTSFNYNTNMMEEVTNENEFKGNLILPTIGCRFYFLNSGDLKAYANVNATKPIITAKRIYNGQEDQNVADYIKGISVWAGEVGFGAEYGFSKNFSISGEFGLRWIAASYEESHDDLVYNPLTGFDETHPHTYKLNGFMAPTYTKVSLNFYFGGVKKPDVPNED